MHQLEQAKLLTVATKLAKAEIEEARSQLLEQINSINVKDGRGIVDARIFENELILQFSDGSVTNLGKIVGNSGSTGAKGDKGDPGEPGVPGPRGDTGLTGPAGKDGERGPRGDKGERGDPGLKGDKGDKGDQGERGEQGPQGIPGERGESGERGEQGPRGSDGTNGRDGRDGAEGKTGKSGPQGVPGRDGKDGQDGKDGAVGPQGPKGDKGDPGSDADVSKLEKKLDQFEQDVDKRISKMAFNVATAGGGPAGSGEVKLYRLDDVDYNTVKAPSDGQALVWSASLGKWQANNVSGGGGGGGISNTFTTTVATQSLIPTSDVTYSIGSNTARYKDIWLSNSTIYLGSARLFVSGTKLIVNDKPLVSNAYLTSTFIANTTARSLINQKMSVANVRSYMQVSNTKAYLANTNAYIASRASWTELKSTNTSIRSLVSDRIQVANVAATYQTKATERAALANTNAYIATKLNTSTFNSALANTNAYIASRPTWAAITSTNTAIRSYVDTSVSAVVNAAPGTLNTLRELASALANDANFATSTTNLIATKISVANTKAYLANTNAYIKSQLANTNAYIATKVNTTTFNSALANTNAYIATKASTDGLTTVYNSLVDMFTTRASWGALTSTNTALRTLISDRLQVANAASTYQTKTVERAALANTNAYIATKASWSGLTSTNTALRALISDRLQVANAATIYQTKTVERAALANTNARINLLNTNLTGTNTALRALISSSGGSLVTTTTATVKNLTQNDTVITGVTAAVATGYLQVANAVSTYATKASPTTSGLLAHTGRATISTNLAVSGNTSFGGLVNINYTGSANASIVIQGTNTKGGTGYHDFLMARNGGAGVTNPNKWFRITSTGAFEIINSAYSATSLSLTDAGGLSVPGPISVAGKQAVNGPAFRAYPSVAQTITSGSLQKVTFGSESYDTNNNFASSRFTPTVEGYYQLNSTVRLDGSNGTGECMIVIYKNGSEYARGWNSGGTQFAANFWSMSVSDVIYANGTTDYFEIYIQQGSGADRTTTAYQNISYFSGCMVRGA